MKIVVLAQESDNHTAPIKWALERGGYQVACWAGLSWQEDQQASLLLADNNDKEDAPKVALGPHLLEAGDRVWIRRLDPPVLNPKVAEADKKFSEEEYRSFHDCVAYLLETLPVWCINKFSASRVIDNKSVQLLLAHRCGLRVPKALMSNSPAAVKDFLHRNPNRSIGKAFTSHVWQQSSTGGVAVTATFELTRDQLPADEVLTYCPGIYQEMVVKQFDVRTVLLGGRVYSYALLNPNQALDWRQDASLGAVQVEIVPTPPAVEQGILAFAQAAGICFGSLDFAVDMDGNWWFLEINEQGQFLWLDRFNCEARILQKFCAFITAPQDSVQPLEGREEEFPSFAEYRKMYEELMPTQEPPDIAAAVARSPHLSKEP